MSNDDTQCIKRQREMIGDNPQHRCLNRQAGTYLQVVDGGACGACPVRVLLAKAGCDERKSPVIQLPVIRDGFRPCIYRNGYGPNSTCSVTGLGVSMGQCAACVGESEALAEAEGIGAKALSYVDAVKRWIQAGRPKRSEAEIKTIYESHCTRCIRFNKETKSCDSCGCAISASQQPLFNKIAMATEKCPLGQW